MGIKKGTREDAIKSLINVWLMMPGLSCASCGEAYTEMVCCEYPVICTNQAALTKFLKELRAVKETRANCYASNKDKSMRWGVSLPANLYVFLNGAMKKMYSEKLFTKDHDMFWFAKKFPQFQVPQKI